MKGFTQNILEEEKYCNQMISFAKIVYQNESVFYKTDVGSHELIVILRPKPKTLSDRGFLSSNQSNCNFTLSTELDERIINFLKEVEVVEKIIFQKTDDVLHVWTVIQQYDNEKQRKAVYEQERLLMKDLMTQEYRFDFYLIESDEVEEILSSGGILIFDRHVGYNGKN